MSRVSSRPVPATSHGAARIAAPTRVRATVANARARPVSENANSGAPQPSTAVAAIGSPVSSVTVSAIVRCSGWAGSV